MPNLSSISFADYEIPDDTMCDYIYESIVQSISDNSFTFLHSPDTAIEQIHNFVDTSLMILSIQFPQTMLIEYVITHDDTQFVFNPGNIFTCNVAKKMDGAQMHPIIRINTTI